MQRIKLLTIVSLLLAFVATAAWAQGNTKRLVLWQKSGEKVYLDLNDLPETTFENGLLVIKTKNGSVQYQMENVLRDGKVTKTTSFTPSFSVDIVFAYDEI